MADSTAPADSEYYDHDYAESSDAEYAEQTEYYDYRGREYRDQDYSDRDYLDGDYEDEEQLTDELPIPEEEQPYQRRKPAPLRTRPYRPGRGGFNPEAAEIAKQAKYAFRRRVVLAMLITAVATLVAALIALPMLWWAHGAIDLALAGYLVYLRRQVRIEEEVRQRRLARIRTAREAGRGAGHGAAPRREREERPSPVPRAAPAAPPPPPPAGTAIVDVDDDDPAFDELDEPDVLPYRRAAGE